MSYFIVDVEADGPAPGLYSMVCFGCVKLGTHEKYYGRTAPIIDRYIPEALQISGFSRAEHEGFDRPAIVMIDFYSWLKKISKSRPIFISDNPAFDWQWINYYFHCFLGENPFGFSARRIGDFAAGLSKNYSNTNEWKKLRRTTHTHNPVDDALGNAEALEELLKQCQK